MFCRFATSCELETEIVHLVPNVVPESTTPPNTTFPPLELVRLDMFRRAKVKPWVVETILMLSEVEVRELPPWMVMVTGLASTTNGRQMLLPALVAVEDDVKRARTNVPVVTGGVIFRLQSNEPD